MKNKRRTLKNKRGGSIESFFTKAQGAAATLSQTAKGVTEKVKTRLMPENVGSSPPQSGGKRRRRTNRRKRKTNKRKAKKGRSKRRRSKTRR